MLRGVFQAGLFVVLLLGFILPASYAGEYAVFGPKRFERGTGKPTVETATFASPVAGGDFRLNLRSGDEQGAGRVSSGTVALNGATVAGPADFNPQIQGIERSVSLASQNTLSVQLASQPGSHLTVTVVGVDNDPPQLTVNDPKDGTSTEAETVDVAGTVVDQTPVTVSVNGISAAVEGQSFTATGVPLAVGENTVTVSATDLGGNTTTVSIKITRQPPRPKVEPQPQGSFGSEYQDLIPADATKTAYDPKRFSLITGEVRDLGNNPIPGVTVSVNATSCVQCHGLEYGSVKTDSDGRFTIPVEGGSTMTVVYQKPGLITSHRQVYVPWNDYAVADTIQMLPEDTASTTVTFNGNPATVMTHRGTPVSDEFGTRSATMVFSGDNRAFEVDGNGAVIRELKTITTRATEFVTPESMPANLPPTSAYTYCAELSVDGAERVRFEKPVFVWVDNFLGFDVGSVVPVGYYDRDRGVWMPSENGVVVRLLDTNGDGIVDALDATGDGLPDDLNGDGAFIDEVKGLEDATRYRPGESYWLAAVTHFTPWDLNWPPSLPPDAISPNPEGEPEVEQQLEEKDDCISQINSFVEDRSRVFHEDIPIPGTDMTLHYASNRVRGFKTKITVPASGMSVPGSLKRISVGIQIAGKTYEQDFPPGANQVAEFVWDGFDRLGRQVTGSITVRIRIGYTYEAVYYLPCSSSRSFGSVGCVPTLVPARVMMTLWRDTEKTVDVGARGVGLLAEGWSLSEHHNLSPKDPGTIIKGDGTTTKASDTFIITTVVGNGSVGYSGDGGPAVQAGIKSPYGVAVDAAGNLYFADTGNHRIRKVDPAGTITTVAGSSNRWGYSGDSLLAIKTTLYSPEYIELDAAGNLYFTERDKSRVRKVDANGIITTIAGNGIWGYSGDGGPATQARLRHPYGLAVDAAGNLYIADYWNNRVRKVDAAGIITTVAGNGSYGGGDGGTAVRASVEKPSSVAVDAVGNLYITQVFNHRIRKVDSTGIITTVAGKGYEGYSGDGGPAIEALLGYPDGAAVDAAGNLYFRGPSRHLRKVNANGIITTIAGNGSLSFSGNGGPAIQAALTIRNIAADAAGNVYVTDYWNNRILKVAPISAFTKAGTSAGDIYFTEENGQGHIVSSAGLHKKTIDLNTGVTLRTFGYDANGNLITITDQFGKVTTIHRDANGMPTSIVSPDGLTTQLTINEINNLTRVTYPDGSSYSFDYTPDGLMTSEVDPNGNRFNHFFDGIGRLTDVTDPEGGHWNYARTSYPSGEIQVKKTTGEGNVTTYLDRTDSTGAYTTSITGPSGGVTHFTRSADGLTETSSLSCGMNLVSKYDLDPEYKFKFVKEQTESTPAGKKRVTLREKTYLDTNADKVPDRITDKVTLNGKATTLLHDVLQAKKEVTSPLGRKVTSFYNPASLLTTRLAVAGLHALDYGYNPQGRLTSLTQGDRQIRFGYSAAGYLASITDAEERRTTYDTDIMGRVTAIRRPDGSAIGFEYDNNGNMTVLTNPSFVGHEFDYNGVDYKSGYQAPLSGSYRYFYDKDRRLVETLFPSGRKITNLYDKDRLAKVVTPEGEITLNYSCATKLGSMSKGGQTIGYTYDGKLLTRETLSGTLSQTLSYVYNNDFAVTSFTYAGGTVNFTYDNDGLLTSTAGFTVTRNAGNGLPEGVYNSAFSLNRAFNGYGEVDGETIAVGGVGRYTYSLARNPAGRISGKTETISGGTTNYSYTYDDLGRLRTVTQNGQLVEEYRYDTIGRRIYEMNAHRGITGRSFGYSDEDHLLTADDTTYQYDLDGFLTGKADPSGSTAYTYSSRGELLKVVLSDGKVIEYVHDPLGRRIAKKINGVVTEKYLWQGLTRLLAVYDGSNNLLTRFQYADARMPVAMEKGGIMYYLGYDQIGSLRVVTDAQCNVVKQIDYDSFGNILADSNTAFGVPFSFAGGLHDRDTNLVRFGYRDYDPEIGRWTAKDPIGFAGGDLNLFGYVQNDAVNLIDPLGLAYRQIRPLDIRGFRDTTSGRFHHDRFLYDDGTDSGYYSDSAVREDVARDLIQKYQNVGEYLNDNILRQAESLVRPKWDKNLNPNAREYDFIKHNCQDYADEVMNVYRAIIEFSREPKPCE